MEWNELYKGYLSRCKGNPLTFEGFRHLREGVIHNKKIEARRRQWFSTKPADDK